MADTHDVQYFLGANSPGGFYSLYDQLIAPEEARAVYILKGGPGCGKSTLMRRVAALVTRESFQAEYILCSGDPGSLDAVLFPELRAAVVDGTAPHVVEPRYPGVVESYVNLGECYDRAALGDLRREIMGCMSGYKGCYQRAYRCLGAAAEIREDVRSTLLTEALEQRMAKRARGILSREVRPRRGASPGRVRQRFLGAVTHRGQLCLYGTAQAQCGRVYELPDRYGLAHAMLSVLLSGAAAAGYDVVACPDPMAPDRLAHLLVPELSLAFLSSSPALPYPGDACRRVRLDAMADREILRRSRPRLRFCQKVSAALVDEAVDSLAQTKAMHDQLEALYNPYVDFGRVEEFAQRIAGELLSGG